MNNTTYNVPFSDFENFWQDANVLNYNNEISAQLYLEIKPKLGDTTSFIFWFNW